MEFESFLGSSDTRAIMYVVGTCMAGFILLAPSDMVVRTVFVTIATFGACSWIMNAHSNAQSRGGSDEAKAVALFNEPGRHGQIKRSLKTRNKKVHPFATLIYPDATSAIASLAPLSQPGRRSAVHIVTRATEDVIKAFHTLLSTKTDGKHTSSCIDDLRNKTIVALDALQAVRMEAGSRGTASEIASRAEIRLRALFTKFREIASNRLNLPELSCSPLPLDPFDDDHFVR